MTSSDPLDQLLRAAELRKELEGLSADQVDLRLHQNQDLRELVEPLLARDSEANGAPIDRTIGDFRLLREIGRGGMGIVYEAWQVSLNRRVALKLLAPALGQDPASIARFHREATLAAGLSHPSLASVHGFVVDPQAHCLVMEYVEGVPGDRLLQAVLAEGFDGGMDSVAALGVDSQEHEFHTFSVRLVADVADALQHAHEAGVIHRDVKPANIIVGADGRAVLTDFGLARETGREGVTMTGELTGTPAYQSPEQVGMASVKLGPLTDVFSLGVTLYEFLTGRKPFDGDSAVAIQHRVLRSRPVDPQRLNPRVPGDLVQIVRKAMQKHPGDRYPTAGALAEDLRRFLGAVAVQARPLPPWLRFRRWSAQNPLLAAFFVLLLVAAIVVAFLWVRAESFLTDYRPLAAGVRVNRLRQAHDNAPPPWPEHQAEFLGWVEEARLLQGWLPEFRDRVDRLREQGLRNPEGIVRFTTTEQQFLYDGNAQNLEELLDVEGRVLPGLTADLAWARTIRARSVEAYADAWREVVASVADDSRFDGLGFAPQLGLIPIRQDPDSKLWEFAHLRSGSLPTADEEGRWIITGETAIVFVLVPPNSFAMGCQSTDPNLPNFDEHARDRDGPVHDVEINQPFFLSKYELSRGQWQRLGGVLNIRDDRDTEDEEDLERYPMVGQSYDEVVHRLARHGLQLPTESQWEMCSRAGQDTKWSCGSDEANLVLMANIRDQELFDHRVDVNPPTSPEYSRHRDGFARQAPVGALGLRPNPWGFHQVHGNADEFCRDWFNKASYDKAGPPGLREGLRLAVSTARVVRGGTNLREVFKTGSGIRNGVAPGARSRSIGVRPSRAVFD